MRQATLRLFVVLLVELGLVIVAVFTRVYTERALSDASNKAGVKDEIAFVRHLLVHGELEFRRGSKHCMGDRNRATRRSASPVRGRCILGAGTEHYSLLVAGTLARMTGSVWGGLDGGTKHCLLVDHHVGNTIVWCGNPMRRCYNGDLDVFAVTIEEFVAES